eukprot:11178229-Alexandrium_andersonii.AAC.1
MAMLFQTVDALVNHFEPGIARDHELPRTVIGNLFWLRWFKNRHNFNLVLCDEAFAVQLLQQVATEMMFSEAVGEAN